MCIQIIGKYNDFEKICKFHQTEHKIVFYDVVCLFRALWCYILTINVPVPVVYGVGRDDFDAGNIHYKGYWKGWALKIDTFLGPEMETSEASAIWAKKFKTR